MDIQEKELKERIAIADRAVETLLAGIANSDQTVGLSVTAGSCNDMVSRIRQLAARARQSYVERGEQVPAHVQRVLIGTARFSVNTGLEIVSTVDHSAESSREGRTTKNVYEVLRQKEMELTRVEKEVEALRMVAPLLADIREPEPLSGSASPLEPNQSDGCMNESDDRPVFGSATAGRRRRSNSSAFRA